MATLTFADLKPGPKPAAAPPSPKSPPQAKSPPPAESKPEKPKGDRSRHKALYGTQVAVV